MNLKNETLNILHENGKSAKDIEWVGGKDFTIPIDLFWKLADIEYDDSYGVAEIAPDLVVVGKDFWLERNEYDGKEWWSFKKMPVMPQKTKNIKSLEGEYALQDDNYLKIGDEVYFTSRKETGIINKIEFFDNIHRVYKTNIGAFFFDKNIGENVFPVRKGK